MKRPSILLALAGLLAATAACGSTTGTATTTGTAPTTVTVAGATATATATRTVVTSAVTTRTVTAPATTVVVTTASTVTGDGESEAEPTDQVVEDPIDDGGSPTGLEVGPDDGITASDDDGAATIHVLGVRRTTKALGKYSDPPEKGVFLLIEVEYLATESAYDYNPYDWTVRDTEGHTFDLASAQYDVDNPLDSGTVAEGSKARGTVVIDAPTGALTLEFGGGFGTAPASWDIPAS